MEEIEKLNNSIKNTKNEGQKLNNLKIKQQKTLAKQVPQSTSEVLNTIKIKSDLDMNATEETIEAIEDEPGVYSMLSSSVRYTMFKKKFAKLAYQTRLQDYESDLQKDNYVCV